MPLKPRPSGLAFSLSSPVVAVTKCSKGQSPPPYLLLQGVLPNPHTGQGGWGVGGLPSAFQSVLTPCDCDSFPGIYLGMTIQGQDKVMDF